MNTATGEHPNAVLLRDLYADLTRVGEHVTDDVVYHLATRDLPHAGPARISGRDAVIACEQALHQATAGTLTADIAGVTATAHFGAVTGTFHARFHGVPASVPFCGLWRFENGKITEHWQNAHDPARIHALLG